MVCFPNKRLTGVCRLDSARVRSGAECFSPRWLLVAAYVADHLRQATYQGVDLAIGNAAADDTVDFGTRLVTAAFQRAAAAGQTHCASRGRRSCRGAA